MTVFVGDNGTYTVDGPVARGRSGEVFRGVAGDGTRVAVKVYDRPDGAELEAARLRAVDHPNVVRAIDVGSTRERSWLATQWHDGSTLARLLAEQAPFDLDRTRRLVRRLAEALDSLHRAGVVHGDLSPNNVLVGPGDEITVIDLGSARTHDAAAVDETTGVDLVVTPRYAAPEVAAGSLPGPSSDRYALALIAYEATTGAFPFPDVATPIAMLAHHASSEPVLASEHRPSLPAGIDGAFHHALAKNPHDRPATAACFAELFERDERWSTPPSRRQRRLLGIGVTALAALAAAGTFWWTAASGDAAQPSAQQDRVGPAGTARDLACNLVAVADFDDARLPAHFYGGDDTNTAIRVRDGGVDGTAALRLGSAGQYGLYGETVAIVEGITYVFSPALRADGAVETSAVYIDFLDADFDQLTMERDGIELGNSVAGPDWTRSTTRAVAPPGAAYAVPTIFKDGSDGSVVVDEIVFGAAQSCPDLAT
ncbi:MAG: serine/threonine protein kinase [Ilumatobacter sp.]|uniref:serine/threonine protein kinase n=1 Tax=Ilumatobacter sp. TaxID=1967498 RepID=UPI00391968E8